MNAEIIEFPDQGRDNSLASAIARLETVLREVERAADNEPVAGVDQLLALMERMGDQLLDLACLLLDEERKLEARRALESLSDKIAETRKVLAPAEGPKPT